ncbi:MAG: Lrp/AsnC family transcriptional regulator [Candidatus Bathyarchaeia archaeon]
MSKNQPALNTASINNALLITMNKVKYDSVDLKILRLLQKDGRKPFAEIARELNLSPGVVQARYAKMKKLGLIVGSTVIIDPYKIGLKYAASIGIVACESKVEAVKRYLEELRIKNAVTYVWITFGRYNISMVVFLEDIKDVFKLKNMIMLNQAVDKVDVSLTKCVFSEYQKLNLERMLE